MDLTTNNILLIGSILLFVSLVAGKTSSRFGVPVLVLFLTVGMLAGSEGVGGIYFDDPRLTQFIGIIALNFILFSGGLDTDFKAIKPVLYQGITLSSIGVLLTATLVGLFVWWITDFTLVEGLLLGSIVSSTDSAAVFSILRSKGLGLKGNLRPVLELESGSNDPMAYVLTILFTAMVVNQQGSAVEVITMLFSQFLIGGAFGYVFGRLGTMVINRISLDYEGLYIVLGIAIMFFSFSATDFVGGNGFLAVYICAVYLGNQDLMHKKKYIKSFDSFAWLMQIVLFITLGLLVFPSEIVPIVNIGLVISAMLILVARPVSVWLCLTPFRVPWREKSFISWVGLRGAVPIVFATYPLIAGADKAGMIFNIVFFISLTSVILQGTSLARVARWLGLTVPEDMKQRTQIDIVLEDRPKSVLRHIDVPPDCPVIGKRLVDLKFPSTSTISLIVRDKKYLTPGGATTIQGGDRLFVLAEKQEDMDDVMSCLELVEAGAG